mmetsp:Transcript_15079/g.58983  ORF Transcript_15079/g.58983 Transcript_15079/m.58983 type:complete len:217 (+) Transcript_15079:1648-2298(+)
MCEIHTHLSLRTMSSAASTPTQRTSCPSVPSPVSTNTDPLSFWSTTMPVTLRYLAGADDPVPRKMISASPSFIAARPGGTSSSASASAPFPAILAILAASAAATEPSSAARSRSARIASLVSCAGAFVRSKPTLCFGQSVYEAPFIPAKTFAAKASFVPAVTRRARSVASLTAASNSATSSARPLAGSGKHVGSTRWSLALTFAADRNTGAPFVSR